MEIGWNRVGFLRRSVSDGKGLGPVYEADGSACLAPNQAELRGKAPEFERAFALLASDDFCFFWHS